MQEMETVLSPQYHLIMMMKTVRNLIHVMSNTLFTRICRELEDWCNLRVLSRKFLRQKSCYPETFRFFLTLWSIWALLNAVGGPFHLPNPPDSHSSSDKKNFPTRGSRIADSAQTEYCSTVPLSVRPCVRVSQAWHLKFIAYIKA